MPGPISNRTGKVLSTTLAPRSRRSSSGNIQSLWVGRVPLIPPPTLEYLVIGGGGTTGYGNAGAGGYRTNKSGQTSGAGSGAEASFNTPAAPFTVTVGAVGNDSVMSTITSTKGGNGGDIGFTGAIGGSGSGVGRIFVSSLGSGGAGTANQGRAGGGSSTEGIGYPGGGGGGGGASGVGGNGTATSYPSAIPAGVGGNGGAGLSNNITGTAVTRAGGLGGSGNYSGAAGSAGSGGGTNTGSGNQAGLVIIAYDSTYDFPTIDAGLTYSTDNAVGRAGFKVITFTAGTGTVSWA